MHARQSQYFIALPASSKYNDEEFADKYNNLGPLNSLYRQTPSYRHFSYFMGLILRNMFYQYIYIYRVPRAILHVHRVYYLYEI